MGTNLNITNNDCDEEGRGMTFPESCRAVRDNDEGFTRPITSESEDRTADNTPAK